MNFSTALLSLRQGLKVKRKYSDRYWFLDGDKIKLSDGTVVGKLDVLENCICDDWELFEKPKSETDMEWRYDVPDDAKECIVCVLNEANQTTYCTTGWHYIDWHINRLSFEKGKDRVIAWCRMPKPIPVQKPPLSPEWNTGIPKDDLEYIVSIRDYASNTEFVTTGRYINDEWNISKGRKLASSEYVEGWLPEPVFSVSDMLEYYWGKERGE